MANLLDVVYPEGMGYEEVLEFWFGGLDERGMASDEAIKRWWQKSDAFDREIEERFGALRRRVMAGEHDDWLEQPESLVAYIVVLDQFSRNLGRGTPTMFEADGLALGATKKAMILGWDEDALKIAHTVALYMPLMHSEELADQNLCVEVFERLAARYPDVEVLRANIKFTIMHRDIVARFGRFPHRNEILGRETTAEEAAFLTQPGSSF